MSMRKKHLAINSYLHHEPGIPLQSLRKWLLIVFCSKLHKLFTTCTFLTVKMWEENIKWFSFFPAPTTVFTLRFNVKNVWPNASPSPGFPSQSWLIRLTGLGPVPAVLRLERLYSCHITTNLYKFRATTREFLMAKKPSIWWKTLKWIITVSLTNRKGPSWIKKASKTLQISVLYLVKREASRAPWSSPPDSPSGWVFTTI